MKTILNSLVLLSVVGLTAAAALESFGLNLAGSIAYALPFGTFIIGLLLLTFMQDYDVARRAFEPRRQRRLLMLPASEAFAGVGGAARPRVLRWNANVKTTRRVSAIVSR